jgi:tetratricopeptide (TPR) repeat protein
MVRRICGRPSWLFMLAAVAVIATALPAVAQSTGMVRGTVSDDKGQPVEGAKVSIEMNGGTGRRFETKSDKKGQFMQIGLGSGQYKVTAEKDKLGSAPVTVTVRANTTQEANLMLGIASAAASKEAAAKSTELKKVFEEGVALSSAGKHSEAIEKFTAGTTLSPSCFDCYNNIGYSYAQLKEWDKAEAAYKNLSAAGGATGNADAQYNQGVILWNAGKIADAKKSFEAAVQANPSHAEAHYQLGMALV